jgi:hypothetical protein
MCIKIRAGPEGGEMAVSGFIGKFFNDQNTQPFGHAKKIAENLCPRLLNEFRCSRHAPTLRVVPFNAAIERSRHRPLEARRQGRLSTGRYATVGPLVRTCGKPEIFLERPMYVGDTLKKTGPSVAACPALVRCRCAGRHGVGWQVARCRVTAWHVPGWQGYKCAGGPGLQGRFHQRTETAEGAGVRCNLLRIG